MSDLPLTIYILHYEAHERLEQILDSLLPFTPGSAEIIVGDNSRSDVALSVIDARHDQFGGSLRLLRHSADIGTVGNILRAYEVARGKYVWLVSVNDEFLPAAVKTVNDVLSVHDSPFVMFPSNDIKKGPWPGAVTFFTFLDAFRSLGIGPMLSIGSTVFHTAYARRWLSVCYEAASSLIPNTVVMAMGVDADNSLYFHPVQVLRRRERNGRAWDPRKLWQSLALIYPNPGDWSKWKAVRGDVLRQSASWLLATERERAPMTSRTVVYTLAQFGIAGVPLGLRMLGRILRRKFIRRASGSC